MDARTRLSRSCRKASHRRGADEDPKTTFAEVHRAPVCRVDRYSADTGGGDALVVRRGVRDSVGIDGADDPRGRPYFREQGGVWPEDSADDRRPARAGAFKREVPGASRGYSSRRYRRVRVSARTRARSDKAGDRPSWRQGPGDQRSGVAQWRADRRSACVLLDPRDGAIGVLADGQLSYA